MTDPNAANRSGLVAVLGRPNVGKSSLINALVGDKVSIVTHKAQTTRQRAVGVVTGAGFQIGLVDTPGLQGQHRHALNRVMNESAHAAREGVDAVLLVVTALHWDAADDHALAIAQDAGLPVGLAVNKVDRVGDKNRLLPYLRATAERADFAFLMPISATERDNFEPLLAELKALLPSGAPLFPVDEITDRSLRFIAAETVREKLMLSLHEELPYELAVTIEDWEQSAEGVAISAIVWVARTTHKAMVIGRGGSVLKRVGTSARKELAERLGKRVDIRLWVKVRKAWIDDEAAVRGFAD